MTGHGHATGYERRKLREGLNSLLPDQHPGLTVAEHPMQPDFALLLCEVSEEVQQYLGQMGPR